MRNKVYFLPFVAVAFALLLGACGGAGGTASEAPVITIGGAQFQLAGTAGVESLPNLQVKPGYRFLEVGFTTQVNFEKMDELVKDFEVSLRDEAGVEYLSPVRSTGIFCNVEGASVCWVFAVPEAGSAFWFVLPDETEIDLAPYLK